MSATIHDPKSSGFDPRQHCHGYFTANSGSIPVCPEPPGTFKIRPTGRLCAGTWISATVSGAMGINAASKGGQTDTRIPAFRSIGNRRHAACRELDRESGNCSVTTPVDSDRQTAFGDLPPCVAAPGQSSGRLARTFRYDALTTGADTLSAHLLRYGHLTATRHVDTHRDRTFVPVASIGQLGMAARRGATPALQVPADS